LRELASGRATPAPIAKGLSRPYSPEDDYQADEFEAVFQMRRRKPVPLGDRPLIVLGAGKRTRPPGTPDSLWFVLQQERDDQVADLSLLSRNSQFVRDSLSGHETQQDNPAIVATAIEDVVRALRTGERLRR
jgi:hypothetical protein